MTFFDFIVPVIALAVAGVGILAFHIHDRNMDAGQKSRRHPGE